MKASLFDYLVIAAWLLVLTGVSLIVRPLLPDAPPAQDVYLTDLIVFAMTVLPIWLYLTASEASGAAATWGKHLAGLRVLSTDGQRVAFGRIAVRNAIKLLPWQVAHLAVRRRSRQVVEPAAGVP
ncbi:MAG: RDD family protein [Micropruina sp.]|uniref:RDD family protein n=1 Tax=Micropruina sp. TaxID=2737536 RepID=UPI0039E6D1DD